MLYSFLLQRDVYNIMGIPVDNISREKMKRVIAERQSGITPLVLSTINVNWVVQAHRSILFFKCLQSSDLIVIDGKPLFILAKMLGMPFGETVPGSSLIQELCEEKNDRQLKIFLFGGEEGVASLAMRKINEEKCGLAAVGAISPGFGSVEDLSKTEYIEAINSAKPDILLVALGAEKGVRWIEKNKYKLTGVGLVSHLGATINFLAGTVKRSPRWLRLIGLEWGWRIVQEPKLFKRYFFDGLVFLKLLTRFVFSQTCYSLLALTYRNKEEGFEWYDVEDTVLVNGKTCWTQNSKGQLVQLVDTSLQLNKKLIINLSETKLLDSAISGFLLLLIHILSKDQFEIQEYQKVKGLTFALNTLNR